MYDGTTHGMVHAGFSGFGGFVAHKKSRYKLIRNRFEIPRAPYHGNVSNH